MGSSPPRRIGLTALGLLVLVSAACGGSPREASPAPADPPALTVDVGDGLSAGVHLPSSGRRHPLVVLVPGGGWATADPAGLNGLAAYLAEHGVIAAPTEIRAAEDGVTWPTPVEDVLCAVAAVVERVRSEGYDVERVALLGHSSGAHLAALAVLAYDDHVPDCAAPAVRPDALVGLSGPYDISRQPDVAATLLGSMPEDDPEAWRAANPVEQAGLRPDVPVLLLHGSADDVVPVDFTSQFAAALDDGGHPTTVDVLAGADHEDAYQADVAGPPVARWLASLPEVTTDGAAAAGPRRPAPDRGRSGP